MNMIKRALSLTLVCLMMLTLLCACGDDSDALAAKQEELCAGKWLAQEQDSEEQALVLVEGVDLYEEEIALVDLGTLKYSTIAEFQLDGTYRRYISVEHTRNDVRDFYQGVFDALYEGRASLGALYGTDLTDMSHEDFLAFYAILYGYEEFSTLLDDFVENAYEYKWEDLESGTYELKSVNLLTVKRVSSDPSADTTGNVPFKLENGTLTLEYSDGDVVHTLIG